MSWDPGSPAVSPNLSESLVSCTQLSHNTYLSGLSLLIRTVILSRGYTLMTYYLPKAPAPNTITLGLQRRNIGGEGGAQFAVLKFKYKGINARASVLSITSVLGELHHSSTRGHRGLHPSSPDPVGDSVSALTAGWSRTGMNSPCVSAPPSCGGLSGGTPSQASAPCSLYSSSLLALALLSLPAASQQ